MKSKKDFSKFFVPQSFEQRWIKFWIDKGLYKTPEKVNKGNKCYVLPQLPYPSGAGLHVGHAEGYTACDIYARFQRMKGKDVLQVIGWDSFGLPAENYAIKTNIHPKKSTDTAVDNFREQIKRMGISVDWEKEVGSHNPDYYQFTQWFFLLMYNQGLAYRDRQMTNWCPSCKTVLANDQVKEDKCERCDSPVEQKEIDVWYLKITDYAKRLSDDLDRLDWPQESVKRQKDWIGVSEGAKVKFGVKFLEGTRHGDFPTGYNPFLEVFTTRLDTIFGVTFMVISPEHPLLKQIKVSSAVEKYIESVKNKTNLQRQMDKEKTGVLIDGIMAVNPINGEEIPVFVADYVVMSYGTGAIMGVPAHDERDLAFAQKYKLPVKEVVVKEYGENREDEQFVDGVSLVIYNKASGKYGVLDWSKKGFSYGLVSEGRKDDESYEQNALRGIYEETGLNDISEVVKLNEGVYSHYRHPVKLINRIAITQGMLVVVNSDSVGERHIEDHEEGSKLIWVTADEMIKNMQEFKSNALHWFEVWNRGVSYCITQGWDKVSDKSKYKTEQFSGFGRLMNSGEYNGLTSQDAIKEMIKKLEKDGLGNLCRMSRLHDWSVSRQRFWGAPVPMVYRPLDKEELELKQIYEGNPDVVLNLHAWGSSPNRSYHSYIQKELQNLGIISVTPDLPDADFPVFEKWYDCATDSIKNLKGANCVITTRSSSSIIALKMAEERRFRKLILVCPVLPFLELQSLGTKEQGQFLEKYNSQIIDFKRVNENVGEIVFVLSTNDPYIPFVETQEYIKKHLPFARIIRVRDGGHFSNETGYDVFPKLLDEILSPVFLGIKPVFEDDLPVRLPDDVDFMPTGVSPLTYSKDFQKGVENKYGKGWRRDYDTLDTFMCSSWYYYRYLDPKNDKEFASKELLNTWMPVDFYIGGPEHVTGHLLYSRFFTKVLYDAGYVAHDEPFIYHRHQGLILGEDNRKMSKRWGNVINPIEVIERHGADTLRLYEMFMGPLEDAKAWNTKGEMGVFRFLGKIWKLGIKVVRNLDEYKKYSSGEQDIEITSLIKYYEESIPELRFNTCVSKAMEFINYLSQEDKISFEVWRKFLIIFSPFAPFITEELWSYIFEVDTGEYNSIHTERWPNYDSALLNNDSVTISVQINGKIRGTINSSKGALQDELVNIALSDEKLKRYLLIDNKKFEPKKVIYVAGRILSIVV